MNRRLKLKSKDAVAMEEFVERVRVGVGLISAGHLRTGIPL